MTATHRSSRRRPTGKITIRGDIYAAEIGGRTEIGELAHAVEKNRTEIIEAFVAAGVSPGRISRLRRRADSARTAAKRPPPIDPVAEAVRAGSLRRLKRALADGADADTRPPDGYRPLMTAASRGHGELVRVLLDHGARPALVNHRHAPGGTALSMAIEGNHVEAARLLVARFPGRRRSRPAITALFAAAAAKSAVFLRLLLDAGFQATWSDALGQTALHVAAASGVPASIGLLIASGADPDAPDADRATPLIYAASNGKTANARKLLRAGADPGKTAHNRLSALIAARAGHASPALIALLRDARGARR